MQRVLLTAIVALCLVCSVSADAQCMNMSATFRPVEIALFRATFTWIEGCTTQSEFLNCVMCGTDNPNAFGTAASNQAFVDQFSPFFDAHNCWNGTYSIAPGENIYSLPTKREYIKLVSCGKCDASSMSCSDAYLPDTCATAPAPAPSPCPSPSPSPSPTPSPTPSPSPSPSTESTGSLSSLGDSKLGVIIAAAAVGGFILAELLHWARTRFAKPAFYPQNLQSVQMYPQYPQSSSNTQM